MVLNRIKHLQVRDTSRSTDLITYYLKLLADVMLDILCCELNKGVVVYYCFISQ